MLPGSMSFCWVSLRASFASVTVGIACAFVHCTRSCWFRERLMSPFAAMAPAAISAMIPISKSWRGGKVLGGGRDMLHLNSSDLGYIRGARRTFRHAAVMAMDNAEHRRH